MIASRLILLAVACLAVSASAQRAPSFDAYLEADQARVDTLRYDVRAGEPLIVALPGRVGGAPAEYRLEEGPALSWLVDRSFLWVTRASDRGSMPVRLRRYVERRDPDTVVLLVEVSP